MATVRLPSDIGMLGDETPRFTRAFSESMESGTVLPMLKQEIRLKIQAKRLARGQPEIVDLFQEPKTFPLTDTELKRLDERKTHNRKSAKKCRERKKAKETHEVKELSALRTKNKTIWKKYQTLTQLRAILVEKIVKKLSMAAGGLDEKDVRDMLPDLIKVYEREHQDREALFKVNNVLHQQNVQQTYTPSNEYQQQTYVPNNAFHQPGAYSQHLNVVQWLQQNSGIQASTELQPDSCPQLQQTFPLPDSAELQPDSCPQLQQTFPLPDSAELQPDSCPQLQQTFPLPDSAELQPDKCPQLQQTFPLPDSAELQTGDMLGNGSHQLPAEFELQHTGDVERNMLQAEFGLCAESGTYRFDRDFLDGPIPHQLIQELLCS